MWIFGRKGPSGFSACSTAEEVTQGINGTGLTAIITGASSGIGAETSRVFALRGVHVVMAVRNIESGAKVKEGIIKQTPNAKIDVMELDLSSMGSVRKFAEDFKSLNLPLNLLINNAGIMSCPFTLSQDHIELQFATNHLGHFLLTNLLLETMKSTARESHREGRIVNISSSAHKYTDDKEVIHFDDINDKACYNAGSSYSQSKLANILHTNELAKHFKVIFVIEQEEGVEITANSVHPGAIGTNIMRNLGYIYVFFNWVGNFMLKNPQQGAATTCYVALHPQVKGVSGEYFADSNVSERSIFAKDDVLAKKLWDFSLSLTGSM